MNTPNNQQPGNKPADKNAAPKHGYKDKEFQKNKPGFESDTGGRDVKKDSDDRE